MWSHTTTSCQDTFSYSHTCQVFWRSFDTYHDHLLAVSSPFSSIVSEEYDLTSSSTRRSRQTASQNLSVLQSSLIEYRVEEFVQLVRFATLQSSLFVDHALTQQVHSDLNHRWTCTLTVTSLQEPQFTFLYSKFHILHILVVVFQLSLESIKFCVDFWHSFFHRRILSNAFFFRDTSAFSPTLRTDLSNLLRSTDTSYYVFTLSVDQIFTVEQVFTVTSVAREANTCSRSVTHVTEYHCLYVNSSTPFSRNTFHLTIKDSTFVHPRIEYSADSTPQLFVCIVREVLTSLSLNSCLELSNEFLQVFNCQFVVQLHALSFLHFFDDSFEWIDVFLVNRLHTQYYVTIHLNETTVWVPCETSVTSLTDNTSNNFIVQTKVQDSIHHTRHRSASTWTYRNQQRIFDITELWVHQSFNVCNSLFYFFLQEGYYVIFTCFVIFVTNVSSDCETRRHRNTDKVHFSQVGTLTTKQISHLCLTFSKTITEGINSFFVHD